MNAWTMMVGLCVALGAYQWSRYGSNLGLILVIRSSCASVTSVSQPGRPSLWPLYFILVSPHSVEVHIKLQRSPIHAQDAVLLHLLCGCIICTEGKARVVSLVVCVCKARQPPRRQELVLPRPQSQLSDMAHCPSILVSFKVHDCIAACRDGSALAPARHDKRMLAWRTYLLPRECWINASTRAA